MASNTFNIRVNKKLLGAENVEATNDIKSLNTLVLELKNNTNKLIDDTKAKADKLLNGLQETGDNLSSTVKAKTDKLIEDTKKDYDSLKKTIIDENISIKLQEDIKTLQNGLKANQNLSYEGSSITANDTLEGRTEGMRIKGRTLKNVYNPQKVREEENYLLINSLEKDQLKDGIFYVVNNTDKIVLLNVYKIGGGWDSNPILRPNTITRLDLTGKRLLDFLGMYDRGWKKTETDKNLLKNTCIVFDKEETYIPQKYFEGLKSFGEAEQEGDKHKISILSNGKNLFDKSQYSDYFKGDMLEFKADGNSRVNNFFYIYIEKNSGSKIIFNGYDSVGRTFTTINQEKYYILLGLNGDKKDNKVWGEIILPKNTTCYYSAINEKGDNFVKFKDIQIEIGTSKTHYEEYKEDKKDILISAPLRSVDDVQDIMYEDNGQVKVDRKLGKYTFTGDEKITKWADSPNACWFTIRNSFKINYGANNSGTELLCDNFRPYNHGEFSAQTTINNSVTGITAFEDYFTIRIEKSKLSTQDIDGFKAWLKANPTTIVYQLATPTIEIVENCVDIDLDTFQDKTYFNILNSMPGILDFKIPSNLASIVQSHTKDIKILYDLIDRLLIPNLIENKSDLALLSLK